MNIAGIEIGPGFPCRFVAELSNNANGSLERAFRLMDAAKEAGADLLKVQCYSVEELVALRGDGPAPAPWNDRSMSALYRQAMTPREWFPRLYRHAEAIGLPIFASVFGEESLALLESVGNPCYKIASLDRNSPALLAAVKATGKPVLLSAPDPDHWEEVDGLLYCPPGYPTAVADVQLPFDFVDGWTSTGFKGRYLGLSSHCLAPELPVAAVARGCKLLEYHAQLDDEPSELEANISLTMSQFRAMIKSVKATEELLA